MANQLFEAHTNEEHTQAIANLLPNGRVFASKNISNSNFRRYLSIFAPEVCRFESLMLEISREHDINEADLLLDRWERAIGIPDDCFPGTGPLPERRLHVIIKLACMNVATKADFLNIADKLGFPDVQIRSGIEGSFPYIFPYIMFDSDKEARFTMIVTFPAGPPQETFPYTFPYVFVQNTLDILKCIYLKISPANVNVIFQTVP